MALTVREHMALQLEDVRWPRTAIGRKDAACLAIGYNPIRHAQVVDALLERDDAEAAYPVLVHRLRRLRTDRLRQRSARGLAT